MNTSPILPDDPRLTAYALGEGDNADRQAVENHLTVSEESRSEVEKTRAIAELLSAEYAREHDSYLSSQQATELPSNVVAFPGARSRGWKRTAAMVLKVAAMVACASSLTYLTVRKSRRDGEIAAMSGQTSQVQTAPTVGSAAANQPSNDAAVAAPDRDKADPNRPDAAGGSRPVPTVATATLTTENTTEVAASNQPVENYDKLATGSAGGQPSTAYARTEVPLPPLPQDKPRSAPGAASVTAPAVSRPVNPASPDERFARSVVRIRTAGGISFGGVFVANNGLVLAVTSLPENSLQQPCTVFLRDQRELSAIPTPVKTVPRWYLLKVDAGETPAVPLASKVPDDGTPTTVAFTDPLSGAMKFARTLAGRASLRRSYDSAQEAVQVTFAFDSSGALLMVEPADRDLSAGSQARVKSESSSPDKLTVRPFTDNERAILREAAERSH